LFQYFNSRELLKLSMLSRSFQTLVHDYVLHIILANSFITVFTKIRVTRSGGEQDLEREHLYPIIRSTHPDMLFRSGNLMLFEPSAEEGHKPLRYKKEFEPVEIRLRLPRSEQTYAERTYTWRLTPEDNRSNYSRLSGITLFRCSITRVSVFYKTERDAPDTILHAVSIPIECLKEWIGMST
jgi:hypothetical protein